MMHRMCSSRETMDPALLQIMARFPPMHQALLAHSKECGRTEVAPSPAARRSIDTTTIAGTVTQLLALLLLKQRIPLPERLPATPPLIPTTCIIATA